MLADRLTAGIRLAACIAGRLGYAVRALYFFLLWQKQGVNGGVVVNAKRSKGGILFEIQASGVVRATPQQAWAVLTDYGRLPQFVPGLLSSKLLGRCGHEAIVEQRGSVGFLFLRQAIHLVVRVTEYPFSRIEVALVAGDMKHYASHWELTPVESGASARITYRGSLEPDFFVPLLLGRAIVRADVEQMLAAVVAEIELHS